MTCFIHILQTYLRRHWPEAAGFWIASGTASLWALINPEDFSGRPGLVVIEVLAWFWCTLRVMQSESFFLTQGGWQVRPVNRTTLWTARWTFYVLILVPPLILRTICLSRLLGWTFGQWSTAGAIPWLRLLVTLLLGAAVIADAGKLTKGGQGARWAAAAVGLWLGGFIVLAGSSLMDGAFFSMRNGFMGGDGFFRNTPGALAAAIPPGDSIIQWNGQTGAGASDPALRVQAQLPLKGGVQTTPTGVTLKISEARPKGNRLFIRVEAQGCVNDLAAWEKMAVFAVRYSNGWWGWQMSQYQKRRSILLPGLPAMYRTAEFEVLSPKVYPWVNSTWDELLKDAKFVIFLTDAPGKPPMSTPDQEDSVEGGRNALTVALPDLPDNPGLSDIAAAARAAVDQLQIHGDSEPSAAARNLLEKAGSAAVPFVLECAPYARRAWACGIHQFLTNFSTVEHRQKMLELLENDPSIGEVMLENGWKAEAIPVLRQHLENRRSLGRGAFLYFAGLKDPALAGHLSALILNATGGDFDDFLPECASALHGHPGVDWPALVKEGYQRTSNSDGAFSAFWLAMAAPLGERDLFQEQAALWLRESGAPDRAAIAAWIAKETWDGETGSFPAWLRANFKKLRWDNRAKHWVL